MRDVLDRHASAGQQRHEGVPQLARCPGLRVYSSSSDYSPEGPSHICRVIADNQALTVLCKCVATVPMIIFRRVNAAHARQPAWNDHLDRLRSVGGELIYAEHVWPLAEPRAAGPRELPWAAILSALKPFA